MIEHVFFAELSVLILYRLSTELNFFFFELLLQVGWNKIKFECIKWSFEPDRCSSPVTI